MGSITSAPVVLDTVSETSFRHILVQSSDAHMSPSVSPIPSETGSDISYVDVAGLMTLTLPLGDGYGAHHSSFRQSDRGG